MQPIDRPTAFSMDFFSLKGKTAIVTGGNSGLGQAFAVALATAGANLFIPALREEHTQTRELIEQQGVEMEFMLADITDVGMPQRIIATCCERFGTVDILVNNAGVCQLNKVLRFGRTDWDPMIETNLTAAFELSHEALKLWSRGEAVRLLTSARCFLISAAAGRRPMPPPNMRWLD